MITVPVPTAIPTPTTPVVTLDTRDNDDDWPHVSSPSPAPTPGSSGQLMTVTVNIGGNSGAGKATVTGTKLSGLIITGTLQPAPGSNITAPPGVIFQYLTLIPARYDTITNTMIYFTVPLSWLDENHIDPKSIVLYHQTGNGWTALPTTFLYTKDGMVYFSAQSPGFLLFAIAGMPTAAAPVTVATTQGFLTSAVQQQAPMQTAANRLPAVTQTTAAPPVAPAPDGSSAFPVVPALLGIGCVGLVGSGWYVRRWWIRRQNPALFREYD